MNEVKFSIIIPVWNVEKFIANCLDSVLAQSYKNFEIICINDGSTDKSPQILQEYSEKDPRIVVINQEQAGQYAARNMAIGIAKGEYIGFLDADDYILEGLFSECETHTHNNPDVIIFGAKTLNEKNKKIKTGQYTAKFFPRKFNSKNLFAFHTVSWNKFYRKDFLINNDIKFSPTKIGEDQILFVKSMLRASNVELINKDFYIYRKHWKAAPQSAIPTNDFSAIENFYTIADFVLKEDIAEALKLKILGRYLLKTTTQYAKADSETKKAYGEKLSEVYSFMKSSGMNYWWNYYSIENKNSAKELRIEYLKSKFKFTLFKILGRNK